jgi:predicted nucleic acid-binding protein
MKVYLDNCCYNRPYDDQSYLSISLEAQAKLLVQSLIKEKHLELASSFVLDYENSCNPYMDRKNAVNDFLNENVTDYIGSEKSEEVIKRAEVVMATGVKMKDSCHIVCAEMMNCDYLLTTDKRMLKYKSNIVKLLNPIDFVDLLNGGNDDDD